MRMEHYTIYHQELPAFLRECAETPVMRRLREVGMNCGCEYTAFPRFEGLMPYSRFDHSLGVGLIVWHFTGDRAQAAAGLLHDIATPVFAHVVDFMRGDYLRQEATEDGTEALIDGSAELQAVLAKYGLTTEQVRDYHRYPIADNDSPRLSADRLEYTVGNLINYRIRPAETARAFYNGLCVGVNEEGQAELAFREEETAFAFAEAALCCSEIYVADADRYAMQMLSELLRDAAADGVITELDLYETEPQIIARLLSDDKTAAAWRGFRAYRRMLRADQPGDAGEWRQIYAKKRYIDPLVRDKGRVSELSPRFAEKLREFLNRPQDYWVCGGTS